MSSTANLQSNKSKIDFPRSMEINDTVFDFSHTMKDMQFDLPRIEVSKEIPPSTPNQKNDSDTFSDISQVGSNVSSNIPEQDIRIFNTIANRSKIDLFRKKPLEKESYLPSKNSIRGEKKANLENPKTETKLNWSNMSSTDLPLKKAQNISSSSSFSNHQSPNNGGNESQIFNKQVISPKQKSDEKSQHSYDFDFNLFQGDTLEIPTTIIETTSNNIPNSDSSYRSPFSVAVNTTKSPSIAEQLGSVIPKPANHECLSRKASPKLTNSSINWLDSPSKSSHLDSSQNNKGFGFVDTKAEPEPQSQSSFSEAVANVLREEEHSYRPREESFSFSSSLPSTIESTVHHNGYDSKDIPLQVQDDDDEMKEKQLYLAKLEAYKLMGIKLTRDDLTFHSTLDELMWEVEIHKMNLDTLSGIANIKDTLKLGGGLVCVANEAIGPVFNSQKFINAWTESLDGKTLTIEALWRKYMAKRGGSSNPEVDLVIGFAKALGLTIASDQMGSIFGKIFGKEAEAKGMKNKENLSGPQNAPFSRVPFYPPQYAPPYGYYYPMNHQPNINHLNYSNPIMNPYVQQSDPNSIQGNYWHQQPQYDSLSSLDERVHGEESSGYQIAANGKKIRNIAPIRKWED